MKTLIISSHIISFIFGLSAFIGLFKVYRKIKARSVKYFIYIHILFFLISILNSTLSYIFNISVVPLNKLLIVLIFIFFGYFLTISLLINTVPRLFLTIFNYPITKKRNRFIVILSFLPIINFIGLFFVKSISNTEMLSDLSLHLYNIGFLVFLIYIFINDNRFYSRIKNKLKLKYFKIATYFYTIFLFTVSVLEPLGLLFISGDLLDYIEYYIFFIIHSSLCIYFSIKFLRNKDLLRD